jgi:hypothetical protein
LSDLAKPCWIVRQQPQKVTHWHTDHLLSRFVLLEGTWAAAEYLPSPSLAEAQLSTHRRNFVGAKDMVYLGLELLECSVACQERFARENGFTALCAPPGQGLSDLLLTLVDESVVAPFVAHASSTLGAWLGFDGCHPPEGVVRSSLFHLNTMAP